MKMMRLPKSKNGSFQYDAKWTELKNGLWTILDELEQGITHEQWLSLYNIVYTICAFHKGLLNKLYTDTKNFLIEYSQVINQKLSQVNPESDKSLLHHYATLWNQYRTSASIIKEIYHYKSHVNLKTTSNATSDIYLMMIEIWRTYVCARIIKELVADIYEELLEQRKAKSLQAGHDMKLTIHSFLDSEEEHSSNRGQSEFLFYKTHFEQPVLTRLSEYYTEYSKDYLTDDYSMITYAQRVKEILAFEEDFAKEFLNGNTMIEIAETCQTCLIEEHLEKFYPTVDRLLHDEHSSRTEELKLIFSLTSQYSDAIHKYGELVFAWTTELLQKARQDSLGTQKKLSVASMMGLISEVTRIFSHTSNLLSDCFEKHRVVVLRWEDAFTQFANKDVNLFKVSELLAMYADHVLRGKEKIAESEKEEQLEVIIRVLAYSKEKDIFFDTYQRSLATRLLSYSRKMNYDLEQVMLEHIKIQCGSQFTPKLEGMFNDIRLSETVNENFQDYLEQNPPNEPLPSLTVNILKDVYWPIFPEEKIQPDRNLLKCVKLFEGFYKQKEPNKTLRWIHRRGSCQVHIHREQKKSLCVDMTIYQASLVMLLNTKDVWNVSEISTALNISDDEVNEILQRLIKGRYHILQSSGSQNSVFTEPTTQVKLNNSIHSSKWPIRFSICAETQMTIERETVSARSEVNQDRRYHMDAAIVRVMKARRTLPFQELIAEVVKQLSVYFRPDLKSLKTRIESLVESEFLQRDPNDSSVFVYII